MTPETCQSPDSISSKAGTEEAHAVNVDPLNKLPYQDEIERIILRRLRGERVEGFTLEMAHEIAAVFPALPQDVAALVEELKNCPAIAYEPVKQAVAYLCSQSAALASAREVIEPFARVAEFDIGDSESDNDIFKPVDGRHSVAGLIRVGHLRAAREWKGR